jgi:hypothetical protein
MVHSALLLLMLEGRNNGPCVTISLKRGTQNLHLAKLDGRLPHLLGGGLSGSTQHFIFNEEMEGVAMVRRFRRGFTASERTEMWDRWQRGESLKAIGRAFGKESSSIHL